MLSSVLAIGRHVKEEGSLLAPHVVEHLGYEIAGDCHQCQAVTFTRWLAGFDVFVHGLILGYPQAKVQGHVDRGVTSIR